MVVLLLWNGTTHRLRVENGGREHISKNCASYEMDIRTGWDSKVAGTCRKWRCYIWSGNTYILIKSNGNMLAMIVMLMKRKCAHSNQSGRYMLVTIVLLMKWTYAPSTKRVEMAGTCNDVCSAHEIEIRTIWESKCQEHVRYVRTAHEVELRTAWRSKWREHVINDCTAYEMVIRTLCESRLAVTCQ